MRPVFTAFNPIYRNGDDWGPFFEGLKAIGRILSPNGPGAHCYASDDLVSWFKTLGFLDNEDFKAALKPYEKSIFIRSKLWRVYTYCWAVKQSPKHGTKIDLGCYDGKVVDIAQRYVPGMKWCIFDRFEGDKQKHGEGLYQEVAKRLDADTAVFKGDLPSTIPQDWRFNSIGFVHVDLNDGAIEVECLKKLWPNIVSGGIVLLDDYGWIKYRESQELHREFFRSVGHEVLEMPTGVGMVIKR